MRHVLPIKNLDVLMPVLHHLIPPMHQTSFDPNTTLYLISSQAERNSLLRYFVSEKGHSRILFNYLWTARHLIIFTEWINCQKLTESFLQEVVRNRTISKSDWVNSKSDKLWKALLLDISKMLFSIMDIAAKCFQDSCWNFTRYIL